MHLESPMTLVSGVTLPVNEIAAVCWHYGIRELAVFGSATRQDLGPESDIDILVDFNPEVRIGLFKFSALSNELESLLGRRVDLVTSGRGIIFLFASGTTIARN